MSIVISAITYRHTVRRSANFQSVESSIEATAQVQEGQTPRAVLASLAKHVRAAATADADQAICELMGVAPAAIVPDAGK